MSVVGSLGSLMALGLVTLVAAAASQPSPLFSLVSVPTKELCRSRGWSRHAYACLHSTDGGDHDKLPPALIDHSRRRPRPGRGSVPARLLRSFGSRAWGKLAQSGGTDICPVWLAQVGGCAIGIDVFAGADAGRCERPRAVSGFIETRPPRSCMDQLVCGHSNRRLDKASEVVQFGAGARGAVAASDQDGDRSRIYRAGMHLRLSRRHPKWIPSAASAKSALE